jgi:hypothetical protein
MPRKISRLIVHNQSTTKKQENKKERKAIEFLVPPIVAFKAQPNCVPERSSI